MSAAKKLRDKLHQYIEEADDKLLRVVYAMFEAYNQEDDLWDTLSEDQQSKIEQSRKEHEQGKGIAHEKVIANLLKS